MAIGTFDRVPRGTVNSHLNFYSPPKDGDVPFNYVEEPPEGKPRTNWNTTPHEVTLHDIRGHETEYNLDRDAFAVIRDVPPSKEQSFTDDASVVKNYYPEVEQLLLDSIPHASRVVIFDHTIRRADPAASRSPVMQVHIDQVPASASQRVRRHLPPEEAEARLAKGRWRIVNVWRTLNANPVESFPLGFASSSTLEEADIVPVELRYPDGYTGQFAAIAYNPGQKWHYLSGMTGDERLLLECFDSEGRKEGSSVDGGRVAHVAFVHPNTRADAEARESIEVRALVFSD